MDLSQDNRINISVTAKNIFDLDKKLINLISKQDLSHLEIMTASNCLPPEFCNSSSLIFLSDTAFIERLKDQEPKIIIAHNKIAPKILIEFPNSVIFETFQINMAMAKVLPLFDVKNILTQQTHNYLVHPTAIIHANSKIGKNVQIHAYAIIEEGVSISDNSIIGHHSVIERYATIGSHCYIHPHVVIGALCQIGNHCEIHPHTTIGSDGYGYASNAQFKHSKIPQIGNVIIGDHVEIGSSVAIDRATLTSTIVHSGTKIDNLCHIAHNCSVGEDSLVTAGFFTAGSTNIGKRFVTGGNTAIADHISITDGVMLGGRSTVTRDINEPGQYGGHPVQPMREYLKTLASLDKLNEIRKQVNSIIKALKLDDSTK